MEKENKKRGVKVLIISIIIVLILALALSYAYFRTELNGSDQIVKVGELELVLDETSEGISLSNTVGISDSEGMSLTPSTFKLINNGNKAVDYIIYLDDNEISETDTRIDDKYLKYNLNKNGMDSGARLLTTIGSNPNRILDSGTIKGKGTNEYSLGLWITSDVDGNYSGQVFSGKLRVEVSQERLTVANRLLGSIPSKNLYNDGIDTFITGEEPNNYIWYSGKLWRAVSINNEAKTVKLVTQWNISAIRYNASGNTAFEESYMEEWLNDTTVDGFLGNLREPDKFIVTDAVWDATMDDRELGSITRPNGTTTVTDAVGLLNIYEYQSSSGENASSYTNSYLNNGLHWWSLTPYNSSRVRYVSGHGNAGGASLSSEYGIRPSINLKADVKIVNGSGTEDNPYRLEGDNDTNLSRVKLNTRYSGEYITFGDGENNLYRIVSHEVPGLTKITSAESLKENGEFKTIHFGNDINYSSTNTIGTFLNNDYLNSSNGYLTNEQVNMIEENSTWYLGTVGIGTSYKLAKYVDENMSNYTKSSDAKVGLLRYGELMSGQFVRNLTKEGGYETGLTTFYWLLNPFRSWKSEVRVVINNGTISYVVLSSEASIRPAMNLKSNVIITSGDGTKENPFEIALQ